MRIRYAVENVFQNFGGGLESRRRPGRRRSMPRTVPNSPSDWRQATGFPLEVIRFLWKREEPVPCQQTGHKCDKLRDTGGLDDGASGAQSVSAPHSAFSDW